VVQAKGPAIGRSHTRFAAGHWFEGAPATCYCPDMTSDTIRELLDRDPFEPFRIVTSAGESFVVRDPHTVALMKSEVFIARPKSDRRALIPLLRVVTVETLDNGRTRRRRGA